VGGLRPGGEGLCMQADGQSESRKSVLRELVETIVLTLVIYALVRVFLFENYRVLGHSMDPTLENDQFLVVNKLGYRLHDPERGDVIVFRDPRSDGRKLIKRVIGLPGEVVEIKNGEVFINNRPLEEEYIVNPARYSQPPTPIPEDQYFVLGDNRNNSSDSHNWGTLPQEKVIGAAWVSYWPPRLWGIIPDQVYGDVP
jgi:signal peptidase I